MEEYNVSEYDVREFLDIMHRVANALDSIDENLIEIKEELKKK